jgi:predicted GNAT family N-acyltransferase
MLRLGAAVTAEMQVRIASSEQELFSIFRLRYEVYVEGQGKPLPNADKTLRLLRDEFDDVATNFYIGSENGEIVACGRSTIGTWPQSCEAPFSIPPFREFCRKDFYYISKVMLNPRLHSRSAVPSIFIEMYRDGRRRNTPFGIANCNPRLVPIYKRFGWRQFGGEFHDPYAGPQVPIIIVAPDVGYLRRRKSPLIEAAEEFSNDTHFSGWFERKFPEYADESGSSET